MKRKLLILFTSIFLLFSAVAPAFATAVSISYDVSNQNTTLGGLAKLHPSATGDISAITQTFNSTATFYLESATFYLRQTDVADLTVTACLWGVTGTNPNATMLANSTNSVSGTTLTTDVAGESVTFSFDGSYQLTQYQLYAIGVYVSAVTAETGTVRVGADSTAPSFTSGSYFGYFSSAWSSGAFDVIFTINGDTVGGLYDPDPTWDWWDSGEQGIGDFMGFIVPLMVLFIPVLLLIVITKSTDKWIILIGLSVGAGLGYYFSLVPLWVVFLVVIGLIGMAYQSVRGGG